MIFASFSNCHFLNYDMAALILHTLFELVIIKFLYNFFNILEKDELRG